jgi:transposase
VGPRRPDRWRRFQNLCGEDPRSNACAQRPRHDDNLGSHKGKAVRRAIRDAGAKLFFLPKYSPDLNPIEQVFAKLKQLLRKEAARTVEAVSNRAASCRLFISGVRKLLQRRRIRSNLKSSRSSL